MIQGYYIYCSLRLSSLRLRIHRVLSNIHIWHSSFICSLLIFVAWASLVAQMVKCLPTMRETQVRYPGWEDPLEKEMATHSSTLVWKIPWMEETGRLQSMGSERVRHNWETSLSFFFTLVRLPDTSYKTQDHQLNLNFRQTINNFVYRIHILRCCSLSKTQI